MDHLAVTKQFAILWQHFAILGQKILTFTGECKSFGTYITEKPPRHLVCIIFWAKNANILPKITKNANLGEIWPFLGQKSLFSWEEAKVLEPR